MKLSCLSRVIPGNLMEQIFPIICLFTLGQFSMIPLFLMRTQQNIVCFADIKDVLITLKSLLVFTSSQFMIPSCVVNSLQLPQSAACVDQHFREVTLLKTGEGNADSIGHTPLHTQCVSMRWLLWSAPVQWCQRVQQPRLAKAALNTTRVSFTALPQIRDDEHKHRYGCKRG